MTTAQLRDKLNLTVINEADTEREITCGYACDLLSWVMGRAPADCVWITVMSNTNVVAVASLVDVACVIIAEGAELDADALEKAVSAGINVYASELDTYSLVKLI